MTEGMLVHIWISLIFPHTMKSTAFIDELVEKKIWSKHGRFKILPWTCNEKIVWIKIYIFFVIIHFSFRWISLKVLKETILSSFTFQVCYVYIRKSTEAILSVNLGLFGENFVTSFI